MNIIKIVNAIALIPIVFYPAAFIAGIMAFDAPGSTRSVMPYLIAGASLGYPLVIWGIGRLALRYASLPLALMGLIPLVIIGFLLINPSKIIKEYSAFQTKERLFSCGEKAFITEEDGVNSRDVYLYERGVLFFNNTQTWIGYRIGDAMYLHKNKKVAWALEHCQDASGKHLNERFRMVTREEFQQEYEKQLGASEQTQR